LGDYWAWRWLVCPYLNWHVSSLVLLYRYPSICILMIIFSGDGAQVSVWSESEIESMASRDVHSQPPGISWVYLLSF